MRLLAKVCLGLLVLLLALAAGVGLIVFPHLTDEPEFVAPDLVPAARPMPPEDKNAALRLIEIADAGVPQLTITAQEPLWSAIESRTLGDFLESDEWATVERTYWRAMQPILEQVDAATVQPTSLFPEPPSHLDGEGLWPPWLEFRQIAFALRMRTEISASAGDPSALVDHLIAWARVVERFAEASRSSIDILITHALLEDLVETTRTHLAEGSLSADESRFAEGSPGNEARLIEALAGNEIDLTRVSEALRLEFIRFRELLLGPGAAELDFLADLPWWQRELFQPQRTLRTYGEYIRASIAEGESTGTVSSTIDMSFDFGLWHSLREGNGLGRAMVGMIVTGFDGYYDRVTEANRDLVTLRVQLALVAYEREHGALPASLEALTPTYFPKVPIDFVSKKPLTLDQENRTITVGLIEVPAIPPAPGKP